MVFQRTRGVYEKNVVSNATKDPKVLFTYIREGTKRYISHSCHSVMFTGGVNIWWINGRSSDIQNLKADIDRLSNWSYVDNCVVLRLNPWPKNDSNVQYKLKENRLKCDNELQDLSVKIDGTLKPHSQCAKALKW